MSAAETPQFDWREITCGSEADARAEAGRQQRLEDPDEVEWIYLRNKAGVWVARRTPRRPELYRDPPDDRKSRRRRRFGALLDSFLDSLPDFFGW